MDASPRKGLLILPILKDLTAADGITIKNAGIIQGFVANGVSIDVIDYDSRGIYLNNRPIYRFSAYRPFRVYQFYIAAWRAIARHIRGKNYDFIWLRMLLISPWLASFIRKIGKRKSATKLILEYGAYPFVDELSSIGRSWYRANGWAEDKAHRNASYVITFCGQEEVDGVPNIPINNGYDLSKVPVVPHKPLKADDTLRFICVSSLKKWHAYDRLLEGMAVYLSSEHTRKIHLDIIGEGGEMPRLKSLVDKYSLHHCVTFHNFKIGAALDEIYALSHVAIGTLGFHRIGLTNSSSLKNREYFSRGLPVILSTDDKDMPPTLPYVLYVPGNESPVPVDQMVAFAENLYAGSEGLHSEIRKYAEEHVTWTSKAQQVLKTLGFSEYQ